MDYQIRYKAGGFSLAEVVVVLAIVGIIFGVSATVYKNLYRQNDLEVASGALVKSLRYASANAEQGVRNSRWGIKIADGQIVIFSGNDYVSRNAGYDIAFRYPSNLAASGTTEFIFEKVTGMPLIIGTTTITDQSSSTKQIYINAKGTITY